MNNPAFFKSESGFIFSGITPEVHLCLVNELTSTNHLTKLQLSEAASLCMAMVIRYALGSKAIDGNIVSFFDDSLQGLVALSTLRHLANGGAKCQAYQCSSSLEASNEFIQSISAAQSSGIEVNTKSLDSTQFSNVHGAICGLKEDSSINNIKDFLNESTISVHSVIMPPVNLDSGKHEIFSASTMSLGLPLKDTAKFKEQIGRHYLCDICIPQETYEKFGLKNCSLFSEQPVIKIFNAE
ncbi:MAG: hypothetical protein SGJ02_04320 [bacterium]|nr:hypothetical protein [bacterium]